MKFIYKKLAIFDPKNLKFGPMPRYPYDFFHWDRAQGATLSVNECPVLRSLLNVFIIALGRDRRLCATLTVLPRYPGAPLTRLDCTTFCERDSGIRKLIYIKEFLLF